MTIVKGDYSYVIIYIRCGKIEIIPSSNTVGNEYKYKTLTDNGDVIK